MNVYDPVGFVSRSYSALIGKTSLREEEEISLYLWGKLR
jgi:hypothetical protein